MIDGVALYSIPSPSTIGVLTLDGGVLEMIVTTFCKSLVSDDLRRFSFIINILFIMLIHNSG